VIARILKDCRAIAVVGLSSNPAGPSYRVAAYMKSQGYRVIPVNPKAIWMQEGVINEQAAARAREAGLHVVMDRCWLKEHAARSHRG
jgi:predicted CoA-binding protein